MTEQLARETICDASSVNCPQGMIDEQTSLIYDYGICTAPGLDVTQFEIDYCYALDWPQDDDVSTFDAHVEQCMDQKMYEKDYIYED